jgi:predicted RND superfamily exporter protein
MTTFAMLAGTIPVALGIGEAAKGRMSMGIAIIGGILLSTFLTLIVVPAIFSYIDRFRSFVETPFSLDTVLKRFKNTNPEIELHPGTHNGQHKLFNSQSNKKVKK